jgi:type VI secretion system protein ImpC
MAILRRAGEFAMELKAPLLAAVGEAFFGMAGLDEVSGVPDLRSYMESEVFVKWNGFRGTEASRWVALALNRFLLRNRYAEGSARTPFPFEEDGEGLWGNPVWAVASLISRSFSRTGWCGQITGMRGGGLVEDLPVRPATVAPGDVRQVPLQAAPRKGRAGDFAGAGFLALECGEDQDAAVLVEAPTAHLPERYPDPADTEAARGRSRLAYQLVASRIARRVEVLLAQMPGQSPSEIQGELARVLAPWIGPGRGGREPVQVRLTDSEERAGYLDLAIRIVPGPAVWPLQVPIEMHIPLRKS